VGSTQITSSAAIECHCARRFLRTGSGFGAGFGFGEWAASDASICSVRCLERAVADFWSVSACSTKRRRFFRMASVSLCGTGHSIWAGDTHVPTNELGLPRLDGLVRSAGRCCTSLLFPARHILDGMTNCWECQVVPIHGGNCEVLPLMVEGCDVCHGNDYHSCSWANNFIRRVGRRSLLDSRRSGSNPRSRLVWPSPLRMLRLEFLEDPARHARGSAWAIARQ
jgi:hypothetical protein